VLVDWDASRGSWTGGLAALGPEGGGHPKRREWGRVYQGFATGQLTPGEFYQESCRILDLTLSPEEFSRGWCDIFFPMEGMEQLFREVKARHPVGLLSDTDPLHWDYLLANFPWLKLVERPTLSFRIGHTKPAPECYQEAVRSLGFEPAACLFVDDLEKNVAGARRVGMEAVRFSGVENLRRELAARGVLKLTP
jgi:HAD superfamily hydrolase (TIGR01509 family)